MFELHSTSCGVHIYNVEGCWPVSYPLYYIASCWRFQDSDQAWNLLEVWIDDLMDNLDQDEVDMAELCELEMIAQMESAG